MPYAALHRVLPQVVRHWARFWLQIGQVFPFFSVTSKGLPVFPPSAPVAPDLLHGVGEKGRAAGKIPAPAGIPPSGGSPVESFRTTGFTHVVGFARFEAVPVYRAPLGRQVLREQLRGMRHPLLAVFFLAEKRHDFPPGT